VNKNTFERLFFWVCVAAVLVLVVQSLDLIVSLAIISMLLDSLLTP
jgi:hypothetical protein